MKLNIANVTRQHHEMLFLVPENTQMQRRRIPAGGQVCVYDDQPEVIREIVAQHERYGLTAVGEMSRAKGFLTLIFAIDKPVTAANIMAADAQNAVRKRESADEMRKLSAVQWAANTQTLMHERGEKQPRNFAFSVEEEQGSRDHTPELNETVEVMTETETPTTKRRRVF